jgi:hypothetical protein
VSKWVNRAAVGITAFAGALGIAAVPPAWATAGTITTVIGGLGAGSPLDVAQMAQGLAAAGSHVWVMDERPLSGDYALRDINATTGQESVPLLTVPDPFAFHSTTPSVAVGPGGNLFIAYNDPNLGGIVESRTSSGQVRVIAGGGQASLAHQNGVKGTAEALNTVNGIAVDQSGNVYVSENTWQDGRFTTTVTDSRIRKLDANRVITTVAGVGTPGPAGDGGKGILAQLNAPMGLTTDPNGAVYIADSGNNRVRKLVVGGKISTVVGGGTSQSDGVPGLLAKIAVRSVTRDSQGLVFVDDSTCRVRRVNSAGIVNTVAGSGTCGYAGDGGAATAAAIDPTAVAASPAVGLVINQRLQYGPTLVREIDATGTIRLYAGTGSYDEGGDGEGTAQLQFEPQAHLAVDPAGDIYFTDYQTLRRVDPSGAVHRYPGIGGSGVTLGPDGDVYLVASFRINKVDPASGAVTTVAGTGVQGEAGDGGPATAAELGNPMAVAFDSGGDLLITDGCLIRQVDPQGIITTIAGSDPCGESGDGGPASQAKFGLLEDITVDRAGGIDVSDVDLNNVFRIRRIDPDGTVTTIAGGGTLTADGSPATQSSIEAEGLGLDSAGNLLLVGQINGLVRRINPDNTITTVAGGGTGGDGGPASAASLFRPFDVTSDAAGNLYISCTDTRTSYRGGVIRKVTAT